jgi:hypothetical protein
LNRNLSTSQTGFTIVIIDMRKIVSLFFLIGFCSQCIAQNEFPRELKKKVVSNFLSYIVLEQMSEHADFGVEEIKLPNLYTSTNEYFDCEFVKIDMVMGDYELFEVRNLGRVVYTTYDAVALETWTDKENRFSSTDPSHVNGLIGVHPVTGKILFISGKMFLNNICRLVFGESFSRELAENYISLRFYTDNLKEIEVMESGDSHILFKTVSEAFGTAMIEFKLLEDKSIIVDTTLD